MEFYEKDFGKILKANALKQRRMMLQYGTDCMRVYDRNLEQFPVTVDLYGKYARITDYSLDGMDEAHKESCCDIASRMLYVQRDHVLFYHREKRLGREQHESLSEDSVKTQVKENGITFTVDLTRHIDTGLFLDHAVTRQWVREHCLGLSVLNLFSYTGSFSVYAASGGARSVVSVDLSGPYTRWARENLKANGFEGDLYPCVQMDALRFVEQELVKGTKYQLIIFDPPTFSNSHKMESDFDVQRDYGKWLWLLNGLLEMGGRVVFSNNLESFRLDERKVHGYEIEEVSREVAAPGFTKKTGTSRTWLLTKSEEEGPLPEDIEDFGMDAESLLKEEKIMSEEVKDQEEVLEVMAEAQEEKKPAKKSTRKTAAKKSAKKKESEEEAPKAKKTTRKSTKKAVAEEEVKEEAINQPKEEEKPEAVTEEPKVEEEKPLEEPKAEEDVLTLDWNEESEPVTKVDAPIVSDNEEEEKEDDRMAIAARAFMPRPYAGRSDKKEEEDATEEDENPSRREDRDREERQRGRDRGYGRRDDARRGGYGRRDDDRSYGRRDDERRGGWGRDREDRGYGRRDDERRGGWGRDREDRGYGRRDDERRGGWGRDREDRGYGRRDDERRGGWGRDREDRGYGRRDDERRGGWGRDREDRGYGRRDDERRDGWGRDREDRGYGRRDDRRGGFSRPDRYRDREYRRSQKPYGMDKFRPSNARRDDGEGKSFFWLEKEGKKRGE